jgi:amylosucrase
VELAIRRIALLHGIIMTVGGIPLIYLGDEIGTLNDYSYRDHPLHERDSRWAHRPLANWDAYARRNDLGTVEGRVYKSLKDLIALRKDHPVFSDGEIEVILTENAHVLGYSRLFTEQRAIVFANFSENVQVVPAYILKQYNCYNKHRLHGNCELIESEDLSLPPYELLVLE